MKELIITIFDYLKINIITKEMLKILLVCLVLISFSCRNNKFVINGKISGISNGSMFYLKSWEDNRFIDSTYILDGIFKLKGTLTNPEHLFLYTTDSLTNDFIYTNLIIGNEKIYIDADKSDFPWNIDAKGSSHQDIAEIFNDVNHQKQKLIERLKEKFNNSPTKDETILKKQIAHISDSLEQSKIQLIKENINSYAALINFKYYKNQFSTEELSILYQRLSPQLKQTAYGIAIKTQIEYPAPEIGDPYYDYSALNQNGDSVSLSQIKSKYILLHFSSAGCYYSQKSIPELKQLYNQFNNNLEIVKISEDLDKGAWKKSIKRDSVSWVNLFDGKGEFSDAVIKYGTIGTPNYVLISPEKTIVEKWFGYSEGIIEQKIQHHLLK